MICGEARYTEKCHIIPRKWDESLKLVKAYKKNLLILCPTHHKLFDKGLLNPEEFKLIDEAIYQAILYFLLSYHKFIFDPLKTDQEERDAIVNDIIESTKVKAHKVVIMDSLKLNRENPVWLGN